MSIPAKPVRELARVARRGAEVLLVERRYVLSASLFSDAGDHGVLPQHHNAYWPSPWRLLTHMLPEDEITDTDVFVDFGCGKGRVLLEAAERYPIRRLIGVEAEPRLADAARALLTNNQHRLGAKQWEVVTADAAGYEIPDDLTVAYLFDPFTGPVFDAVISRLQESVDRRPRRLRIVYLVPKEIERLQQNAQIRPVRRGTAGWFRSGGRFEYFVCDLLADEVSTDESSASGDHDSSATHSSKLLDAGQRLGDCLDLRIRHLGKARQRHA